MAEPSGTWTSFAEQNRLAWEQIAEVRTHRWSNRLYTAEFFAAGGCSLDPRVLDALGPLDAVRVLHLMCSTGEDSLSLAVLGAHVVAVDISERQVELAKSKAQAAGVRVDFVAADVGTLPPEIAAGGFDLVCTGGGVLVWVPDISTWATVIAGSLRPGGRLVLWDYHPVAALFEPVDAEVRLAQDYFGGPGPTETRGWTHFAAGKDAKTPKYEFRWSLGEIVTALADAGMCIAALGEYPSEADWQFGEAIEAARRLPGQLVRSHSDCAGADAETLSSCAAATKAGGRPRGHWCSRRSRPISSRLLFGSAYHRLLQSHLPLSDHFAEAVVDMIVAGLRPTRGRAPV